MFNNQNFGGWTVRYGCGDWQEEDSDLTETEARDRFHEYCQHPPLKHKKLADFVILENDMGETADSCSPGGSYD